MREMQTRREAHVQSIALHLQGELAKVINTRFYSRQIPASQSVT
jgi:hypothetical protein